MPISTTIQEILLQWEYIGFFDFVLPFLLVFAIIYGIFQYMKIFGDNKAVHIIISLIIGLLAIRLPFFSKFLTQISPRIGVGLVILIGLLILIGLFTPEDSRGVISWILLAIGAIIFIVILSQTANVLGFFYLDNLAGSDLVSYVILTALLIGTIIALTLGRSSRTSTTQPPLGLYAGPVQRTS